MEKLCQDKRSQERAGKILPLLQEGKTVREVAEMLGYASPDSVYAYINQHKLREKTAVTPAPKRGRPPSLPKPPKPPKPKKNVLPPPKRSARVVPLFLQGKTVEEIQETLRYKTRSSVCNHLRRHNFPVPVRPRGRKKKTAPPASDKQPFSPPALKTFPGAAEISLRERGRRIIPLYREGKTPEEIASRLALSVKNVFYYLQLYGVIHSEHGSPADYVLPLYERGASPEEIKDLLGYKSVERVIALLAKDKIKPFNKK